MGRRSLSSPLTLWANGLRVGSWTPPGRKPTELRYDDSWVASAHGRPLSLSLRFQEGNPPLRGEVVENYFENLLPESQTIRRRLAQRYAAGSESAFDLLAAIGRDCVGAIQLLPQDQEPQGFNRIEGSALSDEEVAQLLRGAVAPPAPGQRDDGQDLRISIAGAQEKTALLRHDGRWLRPAGATPTTHILKLPLGLVGNMQADMRTSVHNEWLCLKLLEQFGLPVARAEIARFADHPAVLVVERFDRQLHASGQWILRLPQEDFCQVLGVGPLRKYESDGGPGVQDLARFLLYSHARADLKTLLQSQVLFWLMAATDGHAKNFSLRLLAGGGYQLTPLYDVLSAWPIIGNGRNRLPWHDAKLAMAVSGRSRHYRLSEIMRRHFNAMAARCGWGDDAEDIIGELLEKVDSAIDGAARQLPADFPQDVAGAVFDGMRAQAKRLQAQPPA
ncbi:type II toxin-antitoxin system HipA family toxin [Ramlibacter sp. AN1133]|uniref:type II toxin-antitoxin system HipA family toxin n=1 Tax=Ramlibacter sp. AN1133 TaxID=3133429 RepID=UPI0030BCB548